MNHEAVYIIGYAEHLKGGVSNITASLCQGDTRFRLHPALCYYNAKVKSALFLARSLAGMVIKRIRCKARTAIIIVASKGDTARSIPFAILLKLIGFTVIYHFHKDLVVLEETPFYTLAKPIWTKTGAAFVFLSSHLVRSATEEHRFPPARCHVIRNGISQNWFGTPSQPYEARRIDAVFVGRWSAEKGVADLVALFSRSRLGGRYCCHVYGAVKPANDGSCDGANLVFHGWVEPSEVEEAIRSAKLLFLPSYAEAYPTVLIEAAACGTPFVATEVAGIPDIAQQSKAGATAPPGDIDAMEKAILRFLNDQETWTEASRHGFDWARQQTTEKMVDEWRKLLSGLAGR